MNALLINNILGICFLTQIVIFILSILTFKPLASIIKFQSFHWFKRSSYVSFIMTSSTPSSYHDIMTSSSYVSFIMTSWNHLPMFHLSWHHLPMFHLSWHHDIIFLCFIYHDSMTSSSYVSFIMTSSTQWLGEIDSELSRMRTKVNHDLFADFTIQNYFNFQVWIQRLRKINDPLRNADNFHGSWKQFSCQTNKRLFKLKKPTQKFGSFGRYFSCSW